MASYHEADRRRTPDRRQSASTSPSNPVGVPPSQRDACAAGTPPLDALTSSEDGPDNQRSLPSQELEPDASRDLDLDVERILALVDELYDYAPIIGKLTPGLFPRVPRAAFDALNAFTEHYCRTHTTETGFFWAKYVKTPHGHLMQCFCDEPPTGWVAPRNLPPLCKSCGAELVPGKRYPGSDEICMRCHKAESAEHDGAAA